MKLITILSFALILQVYAANGYAQSQESSIELKNVSVRDALERIEKETGYTFLFAERTLDTRRTVSLTFKAGKIKEALDDLFGEMNVEYRIVDRQVILSPHQPSTLPQQDPLRRISGTVTDSHGEPIIGANVIEKGTTNGAVTDIDGKYTLNVREGAVLQISYIGYVSKDIAIGRQSSIAVQLSEDTRAIDEVVVIGYGIVKKSDLTGSISSVSSEAINTGASNSPDQALRGKTSGIFISATSGQPGAGAVVRIRGTSSILGSNTPLYVIDGIPITGGGAAEGLEGKSITALTTINPSDIESMEILKDASATAIYGSRGANGVIMITTKRGKFASRFNANVNIVYGTQEVDHKIQLTTPQEWTELWNESMDYKNFGLGKYDIANLPAQTDWQKALL
ncbi:MAG: TonB-dependent receptor plug domain-containing protein, partial [Tannerellaceae bacterium]|nr:TonB-dependent receptor plug domain-containing protein [Tannerellaceae bacterium]